MNALTRVRNWLGVRTSPENPNTSLSAPSGWLLEALGSQPSWSGNTVTETTALTYAAAFACINVLAKDTAQLPVFVYRRNADAREDAREHAVWRLLHDRPNPWMTPFTFKQTLQAHAVAWGNGYAEIETDNAGRPINLWPLLPDRTQPEIRNGQKWFSTKVKEASGEERVVYLAPDRVLHILGLGSDGVRGYSVIKQARNAIGMGMAVEEHTARLFSNGAMLRYALRHPGKLSKEAKERLRVSFDAAYTGLSNAHRTAVFEEGMEIEKLGLPAKDAEMIESSKFSIEQMARFFDIPLMRLHSTTPITSWGTGLEQWQRAYLVHTLGPWLVQWEESVNWSLFSESERETYFAEFKREALLQGDQAARGQFYQALFNLAAISPNEIAARENLPKAGPEGDKRFVQLNMVPLEDAGKPQPAPVVPPGDLPPTDEDGSGDEPGRAPARADARLAERRARAADQRVRTQRAYRRAFEQTATRVMTKQTRQARRAVERLEKDGDGASFVQWVREFFRDERPAVREAFFPLVAGLQELVAAEALREVGKVHNGTYDVQGFSESYADAMATRQTVSSAGQLIKVVQDGDTGAGTVVERLAAKLDAWTDQRPARMARDETAQAGNAIARHIYEQAGIERLVWIASADACEMCRSMDGRVVSISQPFLADGETAGTEQKHITSEGTLSHPPLHGGCDCQLVAA